MSGYTSVKDSGKREEFETGSRRDTREGKGRYDLISPIFMARLAVHLENGARKYGDRNWEKGQPLSRYMDSAMRHLRKFNEGHRDEDHLAAAAWNIHAAIHTEEMVKRGLLPSALCDLVSFLGPECPKDAPAPPVLTVVPMSECPAQCAPLRLACVPVSADSPKGGHRWFFMRADGSAWLDDWGCLYPINCASAEDAWRFLCSSGGFFTCPEEAHKALACWKGPAYCIVQTGYLDPERPGILFHEDWSAQEAK